jgi:hypothetical protein
MSTTKLKAGEVLVITGKHRVMDLKTAYEAQDRSLKKTDLTPGKVFVVYKPGQIAGYLTDVRKFIKSGKTAGAEEEVEEIEAIEIEEEMAQGVVSALPSLAELKKMKVPELRKFILDNGGELKKSFIRKEELVATANGILKKLKKKPSAAKPSATVTVTAIEEEEEEKEEEEETFPCANTKGKFKCKAKEFCNVGTGKCVGTNKKGEPLYATQTKKAVEKLGKQFIIRDEKDGRLYGAQPSVMAHLRKFGLVKPLAATEEVEEEEEEEEEIVIPTPSAGPSKKKPSLVTGCALDEFHPKYNACPDETICDYAEDTCIPDTGAYGTNLVLRLSDGRRMIGTEKVIRRLQDNISGSTIENLEEEEAEQVAAALEASVEPMMSVEAEEEKSKKKKKPSVVEEEESQAFLAELGMGTAETSSAIAGAAGTQRPPSVAGSIRSSKGKKQILKEPTKPKPEGAGPARSEKEQEIIRRFQACVGKMSKG